jgi:hypothetical protein
MKKIRCDCYPCDAGRIFEANGSRLCCQSCPDAFICPEVCLDKNGICAERKAARRRIFTRFYVVVGIGVALVGYIALAHPLDLIIK